MMLADVYGHDRAKMILRNALLENRVAHAYLFHGPGGIGKTTLARAFAATLLCGSGNDACGKCTVCKRLRENNLPDFFIISPSGNTIKIEQVRELQKKAQLKPYEAQKKVYLIDRAESMTNEASNCLLKLLEEPPPDTVFLLTTVNPYNLLPTIVSRCQLVSLTKVEHQIIESMLLEKKLVDHQGATLLASLSEGLPGKALEMADSGKGTGIRDIMFDLAVKIKKGDLNELLKTAEELEKKKDILVEVLEQLVLWYRDQLVWAHAFEDKLIINIDKLELLRMGSGSCNKDYLIRSVNDILEAKRNINQNVNLRLTLEVLLFKLAKTA